MKILNIISGLEKGGAETIMYNLIKNDTNEHIVISLSKSGYFKELLIKNNNKLFLFNTSNLINFIYSYFCIIIVVLKVKPDLIQTWLYKADFMGSLVSLATKYKLFWSLHHSKPSTKLIGIKTILAFKSLSILSYIFPKKIICCGNSVKIFHSKIGFDKKKLSTIFNGYSSEIFNTKINDKYTRYFKLNNKIVLGSITRWDKYKDFTTLFSSLNLLDKKFSNWILLLAGRGLNENNTDLKNLLSKYGIKEKVILMGIVDDIENLYKTFDINLLISNAEAFPNVIAESMLSGIPCIASDVGDNKMIISNLGSTVKVNDEVDLSSKILKFVTKLSNKDYKQKLKILCRKRIKKNFSLLSMIKNYNKVWDDN